MYADEEKEKAWLAQLHNARNTSDWISHWASIIQEDYRERKQKSRKKDKK